MKNLVKLTLIISGLLQGSINRSDAVEENKKMERIVQNNQMILQTNSSPAAEAVKMLPGMEVSDSYWENQFLKNQLILGNIKNAFKFNEVLVSSIPHVYHTLWITNTQSPISPSQERLNIFINNISIFQDDWTYVVWCQPELISDAVQFLTTHEMANRIQIQNLDTLLATMPGKDLYDRFYQEKYYEPAIDLVTRYIIYTQGGFYAHLGISWQKDPTEIIDRCHYIQGVSLPGAPDSSTYAAAANNAVDQKYFELIAGFPTYSAEIKQSFKGENIKNLTGSCLVRVLMDKIVEDNQTLFYINQNEKYYKSNNQIGDISWIADVVGFVQIDQEIVW